MLLPALNKARERARQISCASNLNQLGKGLMMYVNDYDSYFPHFDWQNTGGTYSWQYSIWNYIRDFNTYYCSKDVYPRNAGNYHKTSYSFNTISYANPVDRPSGKKINRLRDISGTFLLVESLNASNWVDSWWAGNKYYWTYANNVAFLMHQNSSNFLFCDGHVENLRPWGGLSKTAYGYYTFAN
jgi:prepilin-type processing-associated H-X9-DG protein